MSQDIYSIRQKILPTSPQVQNTPTKIKPLGFALLIIVGIAGLATAGVGTGGLLQAGSLSHLGHVNSIVMIVIGGAGGIPLLIIGITGFIDIDCKQTPHKQQQPNLNASNQHEQKNNTKSDIETKAKPIEIKAINKTPKKETKAEKAEIEVKQQEEREAKKIEKQNQKAAAIALQKFSRAYLARTQADVERKNKLDETEVKQNKTTAAIALQKFSRGYLTRAQADAERKNKLEEVEAKKTEEQNKIAAAVIFQKFIRGHSTRQKIEKHLLSDDLLKKTQAYVDAPDSFKDCPRAKYSSIPVYLPDQLPVVLKESGSEAAWNRYHKMTQARDLCEKQGAQHLVIPQARVYKRYLIETKLPITLHETKEQIGLYIENSKLFDDAVKEFTRFLLESTLYDITYEGQKDIIVKFGRNPIGRYDNVALYLEGGKGKIGLIDLETFSPKRDTYTGFSFHKCLALVQLFPHHLTPILEIAKQLDPTIENHRQTLLDHKKESLARFNAVYGDHKRFVQNKKITFQKPTEFEKLDKQGIQELQEELAFVLRKEHDEGKEGFKGCLGDDLETTLSTFNTNIVPILLEKIYKTIENLLRKNYEKYKNTNIVSYPELLSVRTLLFFAYSEVQEDFAQMITKKAEILKITDKRGFADYIFKEILEFLWRSGMIAHQRLERVNGNYTYCIFC